MKNTNRSFFKFYEYGEWYIKSFRTLDGVWHAMAIADEHIKTHKAVALKSGETREESLDKVMKVLDNKAKGE